MTDSGGLIVRDLDFWLKLIVPGIFFLIWVLNQVMNKEINPKPNRLPSYPPRPGGLPPAPRPGESAEGPRRDPALRFSSASSSPRRADDDPIIILGPEPDRPSARPAGGSSPRRGPKAKPAAKRAEPARAPRSIGGVSQHLATPIDQTLDIRPLTEAQPRAALASAESARVTTAIGPGTASTDAVLNLRLALSSPERLRETFVLNDLLQPPLALRRPRRR